MKFSGYWIRSGRTGNYYGEDSPGSPKWVTEKRKAFRFPTSTEAHAFAAFCMLSKVDGEYVVEPAE